MGKTSIEWTDHSINPIRARKLLQMDNGEPQYAIGHHCRKISPGCGECYASALQKRFGMPEFKGEGAGMNGVEVFLDESKLQDVLKRKKPTKYFWCDMTDMFGEWVPDEMLLRCFDTMRATSQHIHQILTKRPERMLDFCQRLRFDGSANNGYGKIWLADDPRDIRGYHLMGGNGCTGMTWCWLGVSVEDKQRKDRIDILRKAPAAVRFLSCEPLLEDLGELNLEGISWCIAGGESGPNARPCNVEWIRSIVRQCKAAGVACFVKQLGSKPVMALNEWQRLPLLSTDRWVGIEPAGTTIPTALGIAHLMDRKGGDISEFPEDLRVREFPKVEGC